MDKKGFVLFTSLLYMSLLTTIYLVNLGMYASQVKMNQDIAEAYQAQILSRLAVEAVSNELDELGYPGDKEPISEEGSSVSFEVLFQKGKVMVQKEKGKYDTQVYLFLNESTYQYTNVQPSIDKK